MNFYSRAFCFSVLTIVLSVGCAVSPEIREQRQAIDAQVDEILVQAAGSEAPRRCLSEREYRSFRPLGDRHILFESRRGGLWINSLKNRCPDLRHGSVLSVRSASITSRMCEMDSFVSSDWFAWPWYRRWPWQWGSWSNGVTCLLGKFQSVSEDDVAKIEALFEGM